MAAEGGLEVLTSNSTQPVLDALAAAYARETGTRPSIRCDSAKVMLERVRSGERGDVVVLGDAAVAELARLGIVAPSSVKPFARSRIGVAVKAGAPHPDISSVEAFRRTLLEARAVAHTVHGASGMYVPTLLAKLGIADRVKTVTRPGGFIGVVVASGEAEIAVQQISELLAVPGVELVGPLPEALQKTFTTAAAVFESGSHVRQAQALLEFFARPDCAATFAEKGLEQA